MADVVYNPLLKRNLQYLGGDSGDVDAKISALQNAVNAIQESINALKDNKITKVTAAAQLHNIAVDEIFEWQAESQTVDGVDFVNGYFYKSNSATITVTPPVPYIAFTKDFPLNQPYQLGDYNFVFGNYYQVQSYNVDVSSIYTYAYLDTNHTYRFIALKPINNSSNVGDVIFDRVLNIPETITAVDTVNHTATTNNGQTVDISGVSSSYMLKLWLIGNADGSQSFFMLEPNSHMYYLLVHWDFESNTIIDWFPFQCLRYNSNSPYIFNTVAFSQTDTQPQPPNGSDMIVNFTPDTSAVRANIQSGDTIAQMAKIVNSNFGFEFFNNSNFEFTSYITDSNLYGAFFSGLGILIICGWFRLITTDIQTHSNIFRFKGYTPISAYPKFIDEYSNNVMNLRTGEDGKGEWWIFNYRSSTNDIYWEGLPTIVVVY